MYEIYIHHIYFIHFRFPLSYIVSRYGKFFRFPTAAIESLPLTNFFAAAFTSDADIMLTISLAGSTPDITLLAKVSARISGVASEVSKRKAFLAACNSSSDTVRLRN